MNIFISASSDPKTQFTIASKNVLESLGKAIASQKHDLIYKGQRTGDIGYVIATAEKNGGHSITRIQPVPGEQHPALRSTFSELMQTIHSNSYIMIVLPDNHGAMSDIFGAVNYNKDCFTARPLPILVLNIDGQFDFLKQSNIGMPNVHFHDDVSSLMNAIGAMQIK